MEGFICLNKPAGWTSHDCVAKLRRLLRTKRIGHGGTLDPAVTGVLPIAVGRATRLLPYLPGHKAYRGTLCFGLTTSTDDLSGAIHSQHDASGLTLEQIEAVLPKFLGPIDQVPPQISAVKIEGKRLYQRVRSGETVQVAPRKVEVQAIRLGDWRPGPWPELDIEIECGPGTYIRAIARDLGQQLGVGGCLARLQRTRSAGFHLADSLSLEALTTQVEQGTFQPLASTAALNHLPAIALNGDQIRNWFYGQTLFLEQEIPCDQPLQVLDAGGQLLGIGISETSYNLRPRLVFNPNDS
jgi:tRNA pseudouridine55 synthase